MQYSPCSSSDKPEKNAGRGALCVGVVTIPADVHYEQKQITHCSIQMPVQCSNTQYLNELKLCLGIFVCPMSINHISPCIGPTYLLVYYVCGTPSSYTNILMYSMLFILQIESALCIHVPFQQLVLSNLKVM